MVSPAFAEVLAAGRHPFNAQVAEARRRVPGFDAAGFAAFLQDQVDGMVVAVQAAAPARVGAVAVAAYEVALSLCLQGLAGPGARTPLLNRAWSQLFPRLAARVAEQPLQVLGALSNALVHLGSMDGVGDVGGLGDVGEAQGGRGEPWLDLMARHAPAAATVAQLLSLGQVLAWRAGLAHWRAGALRAAEALPPGLRREVLGLPGSADGQGHDEDDDADDNWPALRDASAADPWAAVSPRRLDGWQLGAFSGFGGRFAQPPELRLSSSGFLVRSGTRHFLAVADACGAVLLPATADEFAAGALPPAPRWPQCRGQTLVFADRELALDLPAEGLTLAADAHTVAVASPYTHALRLMPL